MNFSASYPCASGSVSWSPDGHFVVSATASRLILRDSSTLEVVSNYVCSDAEKIFWSPNSEFFGIIVRKSGLTRIFRVKDSEWTARIEEGSFLAVVSAFFSPDSRHVFTVSEFHLRISIWNLAGHNKSVPYIKFPKNLDTIKFSKRGNYLAVIEQKDREILSVYDGNDGWKILKTFEVSTTDCVGLDWSPVDDVIALWDSSLKYKILVYSIDGRCLIDYSAYDLALGIKSVAWDPNGKVLAVGSYDGKIRLLNALSWSLISSLFEHDPVLESEETEIFEEKDVPLGDIDAEAAIELSSKTNVIETRLELVSLRPAILSTKKLDPSSVTSSNKFLGIGEIRFSSSGRYLAARNDACGSALWIWDIQKLKLKTLIVLKRPGISSFSWEPGKPRLSFVGNNPVHYMWTPVGAVCVRLPGPEQNVNIQSVKWNPLGRVLALVSSEKLIFCK